MKYAFLIAFFSYSISYSQNLAGFSVTDLNEAIAKVNNDDLDNYYELISQLDKYLSIIINKSTDHYTRQVAIREAGKLFLDKNITFKISSSNPDSINVKNLNITLQSLLYRSYDKVMVEWFDICKILRVTNVDESHNIWGMIHCNQRYYGNIDNNSIYSDFTSRPIEVDLTRLFKLTRPIDDKTKVTVLPFLTKVGLKVYPDINE